MAGAVRALGSNQLMGLVEGVPPAFTHAQHSLPKEEVVQIRRHLEACGVDPAKYPV